MDPIIYKKIVEGIPKGWKRMQAQEVETELFFQQMIKVKKISKIAYRTLLEGTNSHLDEIKGRCIKLGIEEKEIEGPIILKSLTRIYRITHNPKLRSFVLRCWQNKIFPNEILKKWKIKASAHCDWCDSNKHDVSHLFVSCAEIQQVWLFVAKLCPTLRLTPENILYPLISETTQPEYYVIFLTKQFIHRQFCLDLDPTVQLFKAFLKKQRKLDVAMAKWNTSKFLKRQWKDVKTDLFMN